jgi:hypothetical protein
MNRQDAEEYTKSLTQVFRGGWELIEWAEGQGIPQALGLTTREWVRIRLGGYVQLPVEERRKAVKTLTNKGKSTRQIGGILGVDFSTVSRDLSVANATKTSSKEPQSVANATDKQEPKSASNGTDKPPTEEQINKRIDKAKTEALAQAKIVHDLEIKKLQDKLKKTHEAHADELVELEEKIEDLQKGPPPSDLKNQIDQITGPLVSFIQHDALVKWLSDLEGIKEDLLEETEMFHLERVVGALVSIARRAQSWSERLTPMNDRWKYRVRRIDGEGKEI